MSIDPKIDGGRTPPMLSPPSGEVKGSGEVAKQQGVKGATFSDSVSVTLDDTTTIKRAKHKELVADTTPDLPVLPTTDESTTNNNLQVAGQVFTDSAVVVAGLASVTPELKAASLALASDVVSGKVDGSDEDKKTMLKGAVFSSKGGISNLYSLIGTPKGVNASPAAQVEAINNWFASAPMAAVMEAMQKWIAMQQEAAIANTKMAVEMRQAKRDLVQQQVDTYKAEGDFNAKVDMAKGMFALAKGITSLGTGAYTGYKGGQMIGADANTRANLEASTQSVGQLGKGIEGSLDAGENMYLAGTESSKTGFQATQTTLQDKGKALDNTLDSCASAVQQQLDISTILQLAQAIKSTIESGSRFFA